MLLVAVAAMFCLRAECVPSGSGFYLEAEAVVADGAAGFAAVEEQGPPVTQGSIPGRGVFARTSVSLGVAVAEYKAMESYNNSQVEWRRYDAWAASAVLCRPVPCYQLDSDE